VSDRTRLLLEGPIVATLLRLAAPNVVVMAVQVAVSSDDAAVLEAGAAYLRIVGPTYGFFGLGLALYFASQGAGHLLWPLLAGTSRLVVAGPAGGSRAGGGAHRALRRDGAGTGGLRDRAGARPPVGGVATGAPGGRAQGLRSPGILIVGPVAAGTEAARGGDVMLARSRMR
jgi:hypothetical protein